MHRRMLVASDIDKMSDLIVLIVEALEKSDFDQAQKKAAQLDSELRSLSQQNIDAWASELNEVYKKLAEINAHFSDQREKVKSQLVELKVNKKKLKAYSK